jgi:hypothetical protein
MGGYVSQKLRTVETPIDSIPATNPQLPSLSEESDNVVVTEMNSLRANKRGNGCGEDVMEYLCDRKRVFLGGRRENYLLLVSHFSSISFQFGGGDRAFSNARD